MKIRDNWKPALFVMAVILILRLPAFWTPILDVDESQFAGFADWLLNGGKPYVSSLDTKPLGIYWFYAAVFWLFGRNDMIAVHAVTALWVGLTSLFCYFIARDLHSKKAGFWAALFYAIFTTTYVPKFISTSIVVVMMLPLTASIYYTVVWERTRKLGFIWLSGLLWGIACLFKYQAGINIILMATYLLLARPIIARKLSEIRIKEFLSFSCGGAFIAILFWLYLEWAGVLDEFLKWSIHGSFSYIGAGQELGHFWTRLLSRGGAFIASTFLLWLLSMWQTIRIMRSLASPDGRSQHGEHLVLLWFIFSLVPVCTGGKFYGHYFIQLLPAICVLASERMAEFDMNFKWSRSGWIRRSAYAMVLVGMIVPSIGFFSARLMADRIYSAMGEENPKEYLMIADYVRKGSSEQDTIFVWGFATPIYLFSNRLGASRFLWCDWLTGRSPGTDAAKDPSFDSSKFITPGSWDLFFKDMDKNRPVFFVDTSPGNHHDYGKYPIEKYPQLMKFLRRNYRLEVTVEGADIYRLRAGKES